MRLDLDSALDLLTRYEAGLLAHINDEETLMLPIYGQRAKPPAGGAVEIFLGEHEKLRQFIGLFRQEVEKIRTMSDVERGVLFLIDSQHIFKRLLVHHDNREKKMLYPLLDEVTNAGEREKILAQLESNLFLRLRNHKEQES